jgi:hypothetical protein
VINIVAWDSARFPLTSDNICLRVRRAKMNWKLFATHTVQVMKDAHARPSMTACTTAPALRNIGHGEKITRQVTYPRRGQFLNLLGMFVGDNCQMLPEAQKPKDRPLRWSK